MVIKVLSFEMLSTVFVIWRGLGLEDGMRNNRELERGKKRNRQDFKKEKLGAGF